MEPPPADVAVPDVVTVTGELNASSGIDPDGSCSRNLVMALGTGGRPGGVKLPWRFRMLMLTFVPLDVAIVRTTTLAQTRRDPGTHAFRKLLVLQSAWAG